MCVIRQKIVAETILGKILGKFPFSVNAENWKIEKNPQKCHSSKNTFLFPNLHTRAPKLMIKPKNNFKKSQHFSNNLNILVKLSTF